MSRSHDVSHDDRQLVRYLLGLLSERETRRLEEASIVDSELASRLISVEDDLVDAYVCGTLGADLSRPFENVYFASARRRERVEFAGRFLAALDRAADSGRPEARTPPESPPGQSGAREAQSPRPGLCPPLKVAVALVLLLCHGVAHLLAPATRTA